MTVQIPLSRGGHTLIDAALNFPEPGEQGACVHDSSGAPL